jgi:hypothetical protein
MKYIEARTKTDLSPDDLWTVLMDFASYPDWSPMVVAISGDARLGGRLAIEVAMKDGRRMKFRPTVVEFEEARRFSWLGRFLVRGLFDGLHRFVIEARPGGGSVLVHGEEFRGLVPPFVGKLLKDTDDSIKAMNLALVREAERRREVAHVA